jgi:hypothetical protein
MDVSSEHELTLIERGTDVHLNHPMNPRFATHAMGVLDAHPSVLQKDNEGVYGQDRDLAPIALSGPRIRGSTHGYTSWACTERRRVSIRAHGTAEAG